MTYVFSSLFLGKRVVNLSFCLVYLVILIDSITENIINKLPYCTRVKGLII